MSEQRSRYRSSLESLVAALPSSNELKRREDADTQCRAALALIIERALALETDPPKDSQVGSQPGRCPNCNSPFSSEKTPYCSELCKSQAAFVRQVRAGLAKGTIEQEERQIAFGEKLWRLAGGGYPRRQRLVPERVKQKVLEREGGKCQDCRAPAVAVDHCGSG